MTDDLPQLVQRLRYQQRLIAAGEAGMAVSYGDIMDTYRDTLAALDTLTRALAHYQALGEAVAAEREQALSIIATLGIPDTEDQGGHPVPGATRDALYALRWAARALTAMTQERDEARKGEQEWVAIAARNAKDAADRLTAAAREARAETLNEVDAAISAHLYTNTKNCHREAMFNITKRLRATAARAGQP